MAFLRVRCIGKGRYFYILESRRRGGKVDQKILEYLGRDPVPARLQRALDYWGVKPKASRRRKGSER